MDNSYEMHFIATREIVLAILNEVAGPQWWYRINESHGKMA